MMKYPSACPQVRVDRHGMPVEAGKFPSMVGAFQAGENAATGGWTKSRNQKTRPPLSWFIVAQRLKAFKMSDRYLTLRE